jgi:hypothetical protein
LLSRFLLKPHTGKLEFPDDGPSVVVVNTKNP